MKTLIKITKEKVIWIITALFLCTPIQSSKSEEIANAQILFVSIPLSLILGGVFASSLFFEPEAKPEISDFENFPDSPPARTESKSHLRKDPSQ